MSPKPGQFATPSVVELHQAIGLAGRKWAPEGAPPHGLERCARKLRWPSWRRGGVSRDFHGGRGQRFGGALQQLGVVVETRSERV